MTTSPGIRPPTTATPSNSASAAELPAVPAASWRNIALYVAGVLGTSVVAGLTVDGSDDPVGLLFVMGPLLVSALLRWFGGDGWADAGLRPTGGRGWYLLALLLFPVLAVVVLGTGVVVGEVTVPDGAAVAFVGLFAVQAVPRLAFAAGEEFGWRGYLEPRLAALGVPGLRRHLAVGTLWAVWHVPWIIAIEGYTELSLAVHLPLFGMAVLAMAVITGVMRTRTASVWPAVIEHGMANAVAFPLLAAEVLTVDDVLVFSARPEGLGMLAGLVAVAVVLWRRWGGEPTSGPSPTT